MIELLIPILAFVSIVLLGGGVILVLTQRRRQVEARLRAMEDGNDDSNAIRKSASVRVLGSLGRAFAFGGASEKLKEQLAKAGFHREHAATTFIGIKLTLLVIGAGAAVVPLFSLEMNPFFRVYWIILAAVIPFFLPNIYVALLRSARKTKIRNQLPDAVDLLEVCVSSGMGLDMAWNAVSDEIRRVCPILSDEMALVNLEVQLGATRTEAMRNMSSRTGADELNSLVALLIQSERFGTSIAEALRTFARSMREIRSSRAEESAERMAVKLLFPLVLFIFPVMLIVMAGPAGMTLFRILSNR